EPIRPPVEPDVIEVEAEPVEATPPPAPTPPAQQVAPPSPPAEPVPPPTPPSESEPVRQPIDLNQSDLAALSQIPGIGRTMAQRIIELRERLGGFTSVEQLRQVQGIGPARFNFISRYVAVQTRPETTAPEAPERADEAPQVISPMTTPAPASTPPVEPQAPSAPVEAPGVPPTQAAP